MRPLHPTTFALCLVIALVSGARAQYADNFKGQSGSASDEDEAGGDDSATDYANGFESSADDADDGTTIGSGSDLRDGGDPEYSSETSSALPKVSHAVSNHILDVSPKTPDEISVQSKRPADSGQIFRQGPYLQYPSKTALDNDEDTSDDQSSEPDSDSQSMGRSDFDYVRKLRHMVDWPSVFKQSTPMIQNLIEEKVKLQSKLKEMEAERIKLQTILSQLKGILSEMHERSSCSTLNMTSHEIRIARLRNLFLILSAITNFTPLSDEQLSKFNYDVGLFDPKITEESKTALVQRIATILRNKFSLSRFGEYDHDEYHNSYPPLFLRPHPTIAPQAPTKSTLEKKLRRLRNIFLLVRPLVTGVKLTSEELRELCQSRDGYFEPGLNDSRKIEIITRIAENIRTSHLSQKLIEESKPRSTTMTLAASQRTTTESPSASSVSPTSYGRNSVLVIRMAPKRDEENVHVSGKIQMDLNIEGDLDPSERGNGLLAKLL